MYDITFGPRCTATEDEGNLRAFPLPESFSFRLRGGIKQVDLREASSHSHSGRVSKPINGSALENSAHWDIDN